MPIRDMDMFADGLALSGCTQGQGGWGRVGLSRPCGSVSPPQPALDGVL